MRDLFMIGVLLLLFAAAFKRPFIMALGYIYVDIVQPQEVSWYLLNSVPVSMIFGLAAILFYLLFDEKRRPQFGALQVLMLLLLIWVTITTLNAQLPRPAWAKWDPAIKAIGFAIFLPFVLRTRQRIEAALLFLVLSLSTLVITGGIKTALGGGGYGALRLLVDRNSSLYEGSTISTVAIATIPLVLYLYRHSILVPRNRVTFLLAAGLVFSALLMPIGTEARTGLVCIAALGGLLLLSVKRKVIYLAAVAVAAIVAVPFLPASFTERMSTIKTYEEDASASTRLAVWEWTLDFVQEHPFGGGFGAYRLNNLEIELREREGEGSVTSETTKTVTDRARAYHSSYFEVLGEHGYPGIAIYLAMLIVALVQLRRVYKRFVTSEEDHWLADAARALGFSLIIYMFGSLFVGIAFQSPQYYLIAFTAALAQIAAQRMPAKGAAPTPLRLSAASA